MTKQILIRPYVTEKMTDLIESGRHYGFVVASNANKIEIRKAIEAFYPQIKVADVRTQVVRGKARRQFTKKGAVAGRRPGFKKAIVTLTADSEPINFYDEV